MDYAKIMIILFLLCSLGSNYSEMAVTLGTVQLPERLWWVKQIQLGTIFLNCCALKDFRRTNAIYSLAFSKVDTRGSILRWYSARFCNLIGTIDKRGAIFKVSHNCYSVELWIFSVKIMHNCKTSCWTIYCFGPSEVFNVLNFVVNFWQVINKRNRWLWAVFW